MARALDPAVEATIREALADPTASYVDVAAKFARAPDTIRYHAIRWGLERNTHFTITGDQREKINRMLRAGCWTRRQIAKGAGCSVSTVAEISSALGIDRTNQRFTRFQKRDETP